MAPGGSSTDADEDSCAVRLNRKVSRKWSSAEVAALVQGINQVSSASEVPNWSEIARSVPSRTAKQCREKYKNDLRPDLSKLPWVNREEYILARVHATVGNKWAEICRYIPDRSENTIKNHWNATLRSNSERRMKASFLWTYCQLVQQRGHSLGVFNDAKELYASTQHPERQPLEEFEVNDDFLSGERPATPGKVVSSQLTAPSQAPTKRQRGKRVRRKQANSSASEEDTTEDEEDSWLTHDASKRKRPARGRSISAAPASGQSSFMTDPIPAPPPIARQPTFQTEYEPAVLQGQQPEDLPCMFQQYADASVDIHLPFGHDKLPPQRGVLSQQEHQHVHKGFPTVSMPMWNADMFTPGKGAKVAGLTAGLSAEEMAVLKDFGVDTPGTCLLISPQHAINKEQGCKGGVEGVKFGFVLRECGLAPGETPECERNMKVEDLFGALQEPLPQYDDYWSPKKGATPTAASLNMYDPRPYGLIHEPTPSPPTAVTHPAVKLCVLHQPSDGIQNAPDDQVFEGFAYQQGTISGCSSAVPAAAPVHDGPYVYDALQVDERSSSVQPVLGPMGLWVHTSMAVAMPPLQASQQSPIMAVPANTYYGAAHNNPHVHQGVMRAGSITPGFTPGITPGLRTGMYTAYGGAPLGQPDGVPPTTAFMHQDFTGSFMLQRNHLPTVDASMVQPHGIQSMGSYNIYPGSIQPASGNHMPGFGYHMTGNSNGMMSTHLVCPLPTPQGPVYPSMSGGAFLL